MKGKSITDALVIHLPQITNKAGNITVVEGFKHLPFDVYRVFYIYDIPSNASRGGHSHKECHQFLVAVTGCFEVLVDDGRSKKNILLKNPSEGLYIPPGLWAHEYNFSSGAVCLALVSHPFNEDDYIRDYNTYVQSNNPTSR